MWGYIGGCRGCFGVEVWGCVEMCIGVGVGVLGGKRAYVWV